MKQILILLFLFIAGVTFADSPLTSTHFYEAYENDKMIIKVGENGLNKKVLKFLIKKGENPVIKIAIINKLGWGNESYCGIYEEYLLSKRKGLKPEVFDYLRKALEEEKGTVKDKEGELTETEQTKLLTADDLMCWAYFQALKDYSNPNKASAAAYFGFMREQKSMAHAAVLGLTTCQVMFDYNWCEVYRNGHFYFVESKYEKNQLNQTAVDLIMGYLNLYKGDCEKEG